jgi:hypothetical protein
MRNKKCVLGTTLLVVGFIFSLFVIYHFRNELSNIKHQNSVLSEENNKLKQMNSDYISKNSNLKGDIQKREDIIRTQPKLEESIIKELKRKGFKGDSQEIISNLIKHSELIPYEGVLGGTMGFYDESRIYVLTDQWVLASFNDGHIDGYMLLKYNLSNGKILWKVIDSYLMGS